MNQEQHPPNFLFVLVISRNSTMEANVIPMGMGFAAFGKVVQGMKTVRKIHRLPDEHQYLIKPVKIESITVITKKAQAFLKPAPFSSSRNIRKYFFQNIRILVIKHAAAPLFKFI